MKKENTFNFIAVILAGCIFLSSCSSTTLIQSKPDGAKLYMDGEPVGTTPYTYSDTKIVGSTTTVRLEKEGFEPVNTMISRNERVDVGAIIGGLFVWIPFLWIMQYKPTHFYEMLPLNGNGNSVNESQQIEKTKAEKLRELNVMLNDRLITQEEYDAARAKILAE